MPQSHHYRTSLTWKGNLGTGTSGYRAYSRNHDIVVDGKPILHATSDPAFHGDSTRYTPEDLLVSSLSSCHMLWYLHLCAVNGVNVVSYTDEAHGEMLENTDGSGQFLEVTLHPRVVVSEPSMISGATSLHHEANRMCFIARSVNFPVHHKPEVTCYENA
jgi:organic hydroperoxide reductase OsmC/OhrA